MSETQLALQHFGADPLFVFDPADGSNAPEPGDPMLVWWPIYPRFIRVVLSEGAGLTSHHLRHDRDYRTQLGVVERHPRHPGEVVLRNLSEAKWTVYPAGEEAKAVKPHQRLRVRPMTINFGPVRGSIRGRAG